MKIDKIKKDYPVSYEKLGTWLRNKLDKSTGIAGNEGIEKMLKEMLTNDNLIEITLSNPQQMRILFDFFDASQIHMFPMGSILWKFRIVSSNNHDNSGNEEEYNTRGEAEEAGFDACFSILEGKLN